jgi:hypothetical protein
VASLGKRGDTVATWALGQPTNVELVNLKSAKAIGHEIPAGRASSWN